MRSGIHVAAPPAKPLLIYDGDCDFCKFWVTRWQHHTGDTISYAPLQDPHMAEQFPEVRRADLEASIHLIEPDGTVFSGAEAVYRSLSASPRWQWLNRWYSRSQFFARVSEWSYAFIARHRPFFSFLTRPYRD